MVPSAVGEAAAAAGRVGKAAGKLAANVGKGVINRAAADDPVGPVVWLANKVPGVNIQPEVDVKPGGVGDVFSPATDGLPADRADARSKRRSYLAVLLLTMALSMDGNMSGMSIQPFYYVLNGPVRLYGLANAAYELATLAAFPLLALWASRRGTFRAPLLLAAAVAIAGNVIYGCTLLQGQAWMMLVARLVTGCGAGALGLVTIYLQSTTPKASVAIVQGRVNAMKGVAAQLGGLLTGGIFSKLPLVDTATANVGQKIFNWYTSPGWIGAGCVAVAALLFLWLFSEPTAANGHLASAPAATPAAGPAAAHRRAAFANLMALFLPYIFLMMFSFFGVLSSLFALGAAQYHNITGQSNAFLPWMFLGLGFGLTIGFALGLTKRWPSKFDPRLYLAASAPLLLVAFLLLVPFVIRPPAALFTAAMVLLGVGGALSSVGVNTFIGRKVEEYGDVVAAHWGGVPRLLALFFLASQAGKFAGPAVFGGVAFMATPAGQHHYCTTWGVNADGSDACVGPADQQCALTSSAYFIDGCVLYNGLGMLVALAALQLMLAALVACMLWRHGAYSPTPATATAAMAEEGSTGAGSDAGDACKSKLDGGSRSASGLLV